MKKYFIIFSLLFIFFQPSVIFAVKPDSDGELWKHIQRRSEIYWEQYVKNKGAVDPGEWKTVIDTVFIRLARASGEENFNIKYSVVNDKNLNASAFPGGQFIINSGTLEIFDILITKQTAGKKLSSEETFDYREKWAAPLIAHELGHYYNRHVFNLLKTQLNYQGNDKDSLDMMTIKYTQGNEFDADRTGFFLLKKAGYDPILEIILLELLNSINQVNLQNGDVYNKYIASHPSPHERLAAFNTNRTEWHKWASQMEFAFSAVESGRDVESAISVIESAIIKYPENIFFKKALAVALHKKWLATVPIKEQKLKGIITMPSFRDDMVYSTRGSKGIKVIPGNRLFYEKAKTAYENVYKLAQDYSFNSNYALLLCYSPDENDGNLAIALSGDAKENCNTLQMANNYAVVLYIRDKKDIARAVLAAEAGKFDKTYLQFMIIASLNPEAKEKFLRLQDQIKKNQMINKDFVYESFTPILNLALILYYDGKKKEASDVAGNYFKLYDISSLWARYLSDKTGVVLPEPPVKEYMAVKGIKIGDSVETVLSRWGKPSEIGNDKNKNELWIYKSDRIILCMEEGKVWQMDIVGTPSPKVGNKFGIGSRRSDIEKVTGPCKKTVNTFFIYEGKQNIAVQYVQNVAISIALLP